MVGQQFLELYVGVRLLRPQPKLSIPKTAFRYFGGSFFLMQAQASCHSFATSSRRASSRLARLLSTSVRTWC